MANQVNQVNDQIVPVAADNEVLVDYVSPNLMPLTPDSEVVSYLNLINFNSIFISVFLFSSIFL